MRAYLLGAVSFAAISVASGAQAQAPAAATELDSVVVTARRVSEDIQKVPLSVTAIGQEELRRQKVTSVEDLQYRSPALTTGATLSRSAVTYNIRGQTQQSFGSLPGVQPYFNEVPLSGGTFQLYDLESVQVLKGPQGTLFGRNTTGGAVLLTSRKPGGDFEGYVQGSVGNLDARGLQGAVTVPLMGEKLSLRVSGDLVRRDGYTKELSTGKDLDSQHINSGRVSLRFRPTDEIDNLLTYDVVKVDQTGTGSILAGYTLGKLAANFPGFIAAATRQQQLGIRQRFANTNLFDHRHTWGVQDSFSWDVGPVTIRNIAGYRFNKANASYDQDGTGLAIIETTSNYLNYSQFDTHTVTEEFQVVGETGLFNWIAGAYYDATKANNPNASVSSAFGAISRAVLTRPDDNSRAVFAQTDIKLDSVLEGLKATLGYRYTWDKRTLSSQTVNLLVTPGVAGPLLTDTARFEAPTWTVGLNWQATSDVMFYVVSRRGYKSGGFNALSAIAGPQQRFAPEYLTDYEGGLKSEWRYNDVRGRFNLSVFTGDYTDIQRAVVVAATTSATINAAKATVRGFEFEAVVRPFEGFEISGFWSLLDAKYKRYVNPFTGQDLSSVVFPFSPKHKASLSARYDLPFGDPDSMGKVSVSATVYYQSRTAFSDDNLNFPPAFGKGYTLANFSLDVEGVAGRPVDLSLFVKNAFDKEYVSAAGLVNSAIYGLGTLLYGEPRTYGVQLRYRFGAAGS